MNNTELRELLEHYVATINVEDFVKNDPVQFPRRYENLKDIEISGFLTATISWGKRIMILRNADKMLAMMGPSPYQYIMEGEFPTDSTQTIHRTFNMLDFCYLCNGLKHIYTLYDSMEDIFVGKDMFDGIQHFRDLIIEGNGGIVHRGQKHVSSPSAGSACKRIHMFLRWMVRNDGIVDIGCWKRISPSSLYIPLDVHVAKISRHFGLLTRKQNDRKAVVELTHALQQIDPVDPIKYDFALFGVGEAKLIDLD